MYVGLVRTALHHRLFALDTPPINVTSKNYTILLNEHTDIPLFCVECCDSPPDATSCAIRVLSAPEISSARVIAL
jgi:hypothetical protein